MDIKPLKEQATIDGRGGYSQNFKPRSTRSYVIRKKMANLREQSNGTLTWTEIQVALAELVEDF